MGTNMSERFTEILLAASEPALSDAVRHRFVNELFAGAVPDAVMARYLIQDHRFLDSFLMLLGATLASADTFEASVRFGRFIGMVSGEENTFFLRAFEVLGVTEDRRTADPDTQPTAGFKAIMREAAETRSYAAALSVLVVTEWLYLDWASRTPQPLPVNFVHAEWITLHDNPGFRGFVDFLRGVGPHRPRARGSVPRLFSSGPPPSNSPSSKPPTPTGPDIDVFDRVNAPSQRGTEGFESRFLQRRWYGAGGETSYQGVKR
jgi:thiaminase/transcriptional activator TenA